MNFCRKRHLFLLCFMFVLWGIYGYGIERICGFTIYPDEFGYWANAAKFAGYDWSECAGLGSYYSYGYSILLTVFLKAFQNSMTAYRAALALNVTLLCITVMLLWKIVDRLFPETEENRRIFSIGVAVLYPVTTFYMQMTLTESLLTFLYVLICYLFLDFCEREKISTAISLAVVLVYIFTVHMRSIGVVCACVLVLGWRGYQHRSSRKALLIGAVILAAGMILGIGIKGLLTDMVYGSTTQKMLAANVAAGQISKIKRLFTMDGIYDFCHSVLGKLFYLGMATWGTIYFAVAYCIRNYRKSILQFVFLSVGAQFMVSALYMSNKGRIDTLIYGRYNDYLVPVLIVIGVLEMISCRCLYRKMTAIIAGNGIALCILSRYMQQEKIDNLQGYFAAGIGYVWKEGNMTRADSDVMLGLWKAYLMGIALIVILVICVEIIRHIKNMEWILSGFICVEVVLSIVLSNKWTFYFNDAGYGYLRVIEYLQDYEKKQVVYFDEGSFPHVDLVQFYVRDLSIDVWTKEMWTDWEKLLDQDVCLLVNEECTYLEEIENFAEPCAQGGDLIMFDLGVKE